MVEMKVEKKPWYLIEWGKSESIEKYVERFPEVVDKYKQYVDTHLEDDEIVKRHPKDFQRSVRVLPMVDEDGKKHLRSVATDEEKTKDLFQFLKNGHFHFEDEIIEGANREEVKKTLAEKVKDKDNREGTSE